MLGVTENPGLEDYRRVLAEPLAQMIDECLATRVPILRRTIRLTAAGATHLGVTVSPLFDDRGELHGAICLFSDLTAVKDLEEQLRLKESLATVGELTAGIAHEFRNGLATIHGYGKLIDLDALPAAFRPYVEGIRAETDIARAGGHQLPELRPPGAAHAVAGRPALGVRTGGRRDPRRRAGAWRRRRRARSVWRARRRRGAVEAGFFEPAPQRRRGVRRRVHRAGHRRRVGAAPGAEDVAHLGERQRPRRGAGAPRIASSGRSSPPSGPAPVLAWRWCRRSSSFTTGASASGHRLKAAPAFRSRCRSERLRSIRSRRRRAALVTGRPVKLRLEPAS